MSKVKCPKSSYGGGQLVQNKMPKAWFSVPYLDSTVYLHGGYLDSTVYLHGGIFNLKLVLRMS